jgi:hypothetical protein
MSTSITCTLPPVYPETPCRRFLPSVQRHPRSGAVRAPDWAIGLDGRGETTISEFRGTGIAGLQYELEVVQDEALVFQGDDLIFLFYLDMFFMAMDEF